MARTQVRTNNLEDGGVRRSDLNISVVGEAVIRKAVQGTGVTISSTGADSGTGDVTISIGQAVATNSNVTFNQVAATNSMTIGGASVGRWLGAFATGTSGQEQLPALLNGDCYYEIDTDGSTYGTSIGIWLYVNSTYGWKKLS